MIAKNVSVKTLNLSELDPQHKSVAPGDELDLSRFSNQQKQQCAALQTAFEVGDLVVVRLSTTLLERKKRLEATQGRLKEAGLDVASIPISARQSRNRTVKSLDKRVQQRVLGARTPALSLDEAEQEEPRVVEMPKETGIIAVSANGIQVLKAEDVQKNIHSIEEKKSLPPDKVRQIAARLLREKCQGINKNDRSCQKRAVLGYPYCLAHMSSDMREQYQLERLKKVRRTG